VEQSGVEQRLHERTDAPDGDERAHAELAAGLEVGEHGDTPADARKVVNGQLHLRGRARWRAGATRAFVEPPSAMTTVMAFQRLSL